MGCLELRSCPMRAMATGTSKETRCPLSSCHASLLHQALLAEQECQDTVLVFTWLSADVGPFDFWLVPGGGLVLP